MNLSIVEVDKVKQAVAKVTDIKDARKLLMISEGLIASAKHLYKASSIMNEVKEDRDKAYETALRASEIKLLAEAKLGELLATTVRPGNPKANPSNDGRVVLRDIGLTYQDSHRYQRVAQYQHLIPEVVEKARKIQDLPTRKGLENLINKPHVSHATGENEWFTPQQYIKAAYEVMGTIDVDPASTEIGNQIVQATTYYTNKDNGLIKKWNGNVWLNPPYAQPLITEFSRVLIEKYTSGEVKQACVLVNNATETNWFQAMLKICFCVCFIKGRVKFLDKEMKPGAPLQGQTIIYLGDEIKTFSSVFSKFGWVLWQQNVV